MVGLWEMILLKTLQNQVCKQTESSYKPFDILTKAERVLFNLPFFHMYSYEAAEQQTVYSSLFPIQHTAQL